MLNRYLKLNKIIDIFIHHGFEIIGETDTQFYGICPFTRSEKFYVNKKTGFWDEKTSGICGDKYKFLYEISNNYVKQISQELLLILSSNKGVPIDILKKYNVGWDGKKYTLPIKDENNKTIDIRTFSLNTKRYSTKGCSIGILGLEKIKNISNDIPIFICEGEFDCMILDSLFTSLNKDYVTIGLLGSLMFKKQSSSLFLNKKIYCLFDNDEAGFKGEKNLYKHLNGRVNKLFFINWGDDVIDKFDTRDFIDSLNLELTKKQIYSYLFEKFRNNPNFLIDDEEEDINLNGDFSEIDINYIKKTPINLNNLFNVFNKWFYLKNYWAIEVILAVIVTNKIKGDPLWMFIVGPPSSGKTDVIQHLKLYDRCEMLSDITSHTLVSGMNKNGQDLSLLPRLKNKIIAIKDFTSILSKNPQERQEILGTFRECYDDNFKKVFGNGIKREYSGIHFSIIAAVTPIIYEVSKNEVMLGERFLKFGIDTSYSEKETLLINRKVARNQDHKDQLKKEISSALAQFLYGIENNKFPDVDVDMVDKISYLCMLASKLRSFVSRNLYNSQIIEGRPYCESSYRLTSQLLKLVRGLAYIRNKKEVTEDEYFIAKKVIIDSISQMNEDILRKLFFNNIHTDKYITIKEISNWTDYPFSTISRLCEDLTMLKILSIKYFQNEGKKYNISKQTLRWIHKSELYKHKKKIKFFKVGGDNECN